MFKVFSISRLFILGLVTFGGLCLLSGNAVACDRDPDAPSTVAASQPTTGPAETSGTLYASVAEQYKLIRRSAMLKDYDRAGAMMPELAARVQRLRESVASTKVEPMVALGLDQVEPLGAALTSGNFETCRKALTSMDTLWSDVGLMLVGHTLDAPATTRAAMPSTTGRSDDH